MRPRAPLVAALAAALLGGCTSFQRAMEEFDSVSLREDPGLEPDKVVYQDRPKRMPWGLRQVEGSGLDRLLIDLLAVEPAPVEVPNPAELARERMAGMVATMGDDAERVGLVTTRLLWVLDLDHHPLNQLQALLGLEGVARVVQFDPIAWHERVTRADSELALIPSRRAEVMAAALATVEAGWPATRAAPLAGVERDAYVEALQQLGAWPLADATEQRKLILALARGLAIEPDQELVQAMVAALERAIHHGLGTGLGRALRGASDDLREQTLRVLRRLCGAPGIAFALALISRPAGAVGPGANRYDDSIAVRRALVNFCGQLPKQFLLQPYGRGPSPAEYLYDVIREEPANPGLQLAALEALAAGLGRPFDPDPAWAQQWWQEFVEQRLGNNGAGP